MNTECRCDTCMDAYRDYKREYRTHTLRLCVVDFCYEPCYAKKFCKPHYERQRQGRALIPILPRPGARGRQPGKDRRHAA